MTICKLGKHCRGLSDIRNGRMGEMKRTDGGGLCNAAHDLSTVMLCVVRVVMAACFGLQLFLPLCQKLRNNGNQPVASHATTAGPLHDPSYGEDSKWM